MEEIAELKKRIEQLESLVKGTGKVERGMISSFWENLKTPEVKLLTNEELLSKFHALVDRIVVDRPYSSLMEKYQEMLEEIYFRKLNPKYTLKVK